MGKFNLEELVEQGRNEELQRMLQNADPSKLVDDSGMTLLHLAAKHDNLELLRYLLHAGFNINARNSFGSTPLTTAMFFYQFRAMKILLQANVNIFGPDCKGRSTLQILMSEMEKFPVFVDKKIVANYKKSSLDRKTKAEILIDADCTFQFTLSVDDNLAIIMFLERNDSGLNEFNSALEFAMKQGDVDNFKVLLDCMERKNMRKKAFFMQLSRFFRSGRTRNLKAAELFLGRSMEWDIIDERALLYYQMSFLVADSEAMEVLLDSKVDIYIRNKFGYEMFVHVFSNSEVDAVEILRSRKFNVNGKDHHQGTSALHQAAIKESEKNLRFLLDMGADPNAQDECGITPLCETLITHNNYFGELLLQYGADVQSYDKNETIFSHIFLHDPGNATLMHTLVAQLTLDDARGVPIKKCYRDDIESCFSEIFVKCSKQIEQFKNSEISDSVTLFTVLTAKAEDIARRLRGEDFFSKIEDYCQEHEVQPFYYSTLKFKLHRASEVYLSRCNFAKVIFQTTGVAVDFDHLVIEKICSFLTHCDMLQFV